MFDHSVDLRCGQWAPVLRAFVDAFCRSMHPGLSHSAVFDRDVPISRGFSFPSGQVVHWLSAFLVGVASGQPYTFPPFQLRRPGWRALLNSVVQIWGWVVEFFLGFFHDANKVRKVTGGDLGTFSVSIYTSFSIYALPLFLCILLVCNFPRDFQCGFWPICFLKWAFYG